MEMKWYIVRTQSNHERVIVEKIEKESEKSLSGKIGRILVPMEKTIAVRNGKKVAREKVMYPGYVFVETTSLGDLTTFVKNCDGASGILSNKGGAVQSISEAEVERMIGITQTIEQTIEQGFVVGEEVKIIDGPFASFFGVVEMLNDQRVKVSVMIFGRKTPLELSVAQISKV